MSKPDNSTTQIEETFKANFYQAVKKRGEKEGWDGRQRATARAYAASLLYKGKTEVTTVDPAIADAVNDVFAFGCAYVGDKLPIHRFNGQHQDWFPELLKKKKKKVAARRKYRAKRKIERTQRVTTTRVTPLTVRRLQETAAS